MRSKPIALHVKEKEPNYRNDWKVDKKKEVAKKMKKNKDPRGFYEAQEQSILKGK
jgi:hypothetical protein